MNDDETLPQNRPDYGNAGPLNHNRFLRTLKRIKSLSLMHERKFKYSTRYINLDFTLTISLLMSHHLLNTRLILKEITSVAGAVAKGDKRDDDDDEETSKLCLVTSRQKSANVVQVLVLGRRRRGGGGGPPLTLNRDVWTSPAVNVACGPCPPQHNLSTKLERDARVGQNVFPPFLG